MKKILLFLMIIAMFAACSTPKYTYYFDHYPSKKTTVLKSGDTEKKQENFAANAETTYVASNVGAPVPFELSTAVASTSKEIFIQAKPTTTSGVHEVAIKRNSTNKKGLFKTIRDFKKSPDAIQEGGNKNGFAIAGFVCSLVGLSVLGIIFSALGLKSDHRGLAIAGLIIGIVGLVILIALI